MERIQKALEKAHQKRTTVSDAENKEQAKSAENDLNETISTEISYAKTKTIPIANDIYKKNRIFAGIKDEPRADIFKILRTKILLTMRSHKWNVLAVTGPTAGTGKSLTAVNLAISIAMEANHSVLLADLDFRRPSLSHYFGMTVEKGLSDYLFEDITFSELLVNPGIESLVLLPAGKPVRHSSELLSSPKMLTLAEELKHRYPDRIVIVDLPPLLHTDDAMVFLPNVDACVLVVAEGESTKDEVEQSLLLIDDEKLIGSVLNKSTQVDSSSYYY